MIKCGILGNKLYELRVAKSSKRSVNNANLILRDSFNLFPMALSALPSAFGLAIQGKDWFPHLANCPSNYGITLPQLPPPSAYLCNQLMPAKREAFEEWYAANRHLPFELDEELPAYCLNDVTILMSALVAFRAEFLEISSRTKIGVDPLR